MTFVQFCESCLFMYNLQNAKYYILLLTEWFAQPKEITEIEKRILSKYGWV